MLTDLTLKNLKSKDKLFKVADRDGMYAAVTPAGHITFRPVVDPADAHFALAVEGLETFVERFRDEGIIFNEPAITDLPELFSSGARGSFLSGPDGERIELFERLK